MLGFITLPNATDTFTNIAEWSSPMFDSLKPIAIMGAGFIIGGLLIVFLVSGVMSGIKMLIVRGREKEWKEDYEKNRFKYDD